MSTRVTSHVTELALRTLGKLIQAARKSCPMTQKELANRLGVNLKTIGQIEKGGKNISVSTVFEAAYIVGIPLFKMDNKQQLEKWQLALQNFEAILPSRIHSKKIEINDDF